MELWYVGNIANVVNTTIMLHNMMVAQRIDNDEIKCELFYALPANLEVDKEGQECNDEQEQHDLNCRMAEMDLHVTSMTCTTVRGTCNAISVCPAAMVVLV